MMRNEKKEEILELERNFQRKTKKRNENEEGKGKGDNSYNDKEKQEGIETKGIKYKDDEDDEEEDGAIGCLKDQQSVASPMFQALCAYVDGKYEKSYEKWHFVFPRMKEIGGSDAQLDIFVQTYIDLLIKCER